MVAYLRGFYLFFIVELSTEEFLERIDGISSRFLVVAILRAGGIEVLAFLSACNLLKCRCFSTQTRTLEGSLWFKSFGTLSRYFL